MGTKTFDELGLIVEDAAVTTTATSTGVNITGLNLGDASYVAVVDCSATTGTVDGSNYYTVTLKASAALGGTYVQIGNSITLPATAGSYEIGFTAKQLNDLVSGADYFAVTVTKVGITATAVTYTAHISRF